MTGARSDNPFVGPRSLDRDDGLYGRDRDLAGLLDLLITQRVVLLYSPSGAGKTSLLQAGLIPALEKEERFVVRPVVRVSREVGHDSNRYLASVASCLLRDRLDLPGPEPSRSWFAELLERSRPADDDRPNEVLIFDQFEEFLNLHPGEVDAKRVFMAQVGDALRDRRRWAVFAMREEYIAGLDAYLSFVPTRLSATFRLDFLRPDGARAAIQKPAAARGVRVHEQAATTLIDNLRGAQVQGLSGEMASEDGDGAESVDRYVEPVYLQVVCQRLWNLVVSDSGGVLEIGEADLARLGHLDDVLADYYEEQIRAVAHATNTSERPIRDWFDSKLLVGGFRSQVLEPPNAPAGDEIARRLEDDAHLVRRERRGALWFELAHDRLIAPIRRSNALWREANLTLLQQQADRWRERDRPDDLLLTGEALTRAETEIGETGPDLSPNDLEYLEACRQERGRLDVERRRNRLVRGLLAVAVVLLVVAAAMYWQVREARQRVREQARASTDRVLASQVFKRDERLDRSLLLDVEAQRLQPGAKTRSALLSDLQRSPQLITYLHAGEAMQDVAFHPNGKLLAAATSNGDIQLWDVEHRRRAGPPLTEHTNLVGGLAFSPNGAILASASDDTTVRLWDVERRTSTTLAGHHGVATSVTFSPDGMALATGYLDGTVLVWDVPTGQVGATLKGHRDGVTTVAFGPGRMLASGSNDGTVVLWDTGARGHEHVATLEGHERDVRSVAFSSDGTTLASGGNDKQIILWDTSTHQRLGEPMVGHRGFVRALAFSPDGTALASGGEDNMVMIWNVGSRTARALPGHRDFVNGLAFTPDGETLASSSIDDAIILWAVDRHLPLGEPLQGEGGAATSVAFSPDGTTLASGSDDHTVMLWDVKTRRPRPPLTGHSDVVTSVAFSPDGAILASGSKDRTVIFWDLHSHRQLATMQGPRDAVTSDGGHAAVPIDVVTSVAFNPDGTTLASGHIDHTVMLWDARSHRPLATLEGHGDVVNSVAFSPDGAIVAAGSENGTIVLHDARSRANRQLPGTRAVRSVAFAPVGQQTLAAGLEDGTIILWDVERGERRGLPLAGQWGSITGVAFSPDGHTLASSSDNSTVVLWDTQWDTPGHPLLGQPFTGQVGTIGGVAFGSRGAVLASAGQAPSVVLWDTDASSWRQKACAIANRDLVEVEWEAFIGPGRPYRKTCS